MVRFRNGATATRSIETRLIVQLSTLAEVNQTKLGPWLAEEELRCCLAALVEFS